MKSKSFLALTSLLVGLATFTAGNVYAAPGEWWDDFDPTCVRNAPEFEGKAAYGEPLEGKAAYGEALEERAAPARARSQFCSTEGANAFEPNY
ncbi:MAG: hypothetical protein KKH74_11200 [Gammaproteobacteria bacterium]|nr:hypothetical protein [Gammaproteobacteria bacterium]MBU1731496.1 hypothetical protein [Gammaproteobacteria bacterium]MBU1893001.1 hypothetical protein [Gammaproteobacteria bacterium]